jgi:hypothetical protein
MLDRIASSLSSDWMLAHDFVRHISKLMRAKVPCSFRGTQATDAMAGPTSFQIKTLLNISLDAFRVIGQGACRPMIPGSYSQKAASAHGTPEADAAC